MRLAREGLLLFSSSRLLETVRIRAELIGERREFSVVNGFLGHRRGAAIGKFVKVCALGVVLSGCAASAPPETFTLTAPTQGFSARAMRGVLAIARPYASAPIDGDRIVVRTGPTTIAYLKNAQWTAALPGLVQDRMIEAFENAHLVKSVVRTGESLDADYVLVSDIRRFDIEAASGQAVVQMAVKVAGQQSGRVIAGQIFVGRGSGSAQDPNSATHALNGALDDVLRQIVAWASRRR